MTYFNGMSLFEKLLHYINKGEEVETTDPQTTDQPNVPEMTDTSLQDTNEAYLEALIAAKTILDRMNMPDASARAVRERVNDLVVGKTPHTVIKLRTALSNLANTCKEVGGCPYTAMGKPCPYVEILRGPYQEAIKLL